MAGHDEDFKDESGFLFVLVGLIVLVSMSALPVTVGLIQLFAG